MPRIRVRLPQAFLVSARSPFRGGLAALLVVALVAVARAETAAPAGELAGETREFLDAYCYRCHNAEELEGDFDLQNFHYDPLDVDNFNKWVRVFDRVRTYEMPPRRRRGPSDDEVTAFSARLAAVLKADETAIISAEGRAVQRRLNRYEYENALRDLLAAPWLQIRNRLPLDGEAHRYNKVGEALDISHVQMSRYMSSADYALRQAMSEELANLDTATRRFYARDEPSLVRNFWPREGGTLTDRHAFPVLDGKAQPEVRAGREPVTSPETREREAVGKVSSSFSDAGGYSWGQFRAPVGGRYRLRFKGYTVWLSGGGVSRWFFNGTGEEKAGVYWLPLWHRPNLDEVWPGRRNEPIGVYAQSGGQGRLLGSFDFTPEPTVSELEVVLQPNEVIQTDGSRLFRTRVNGTNEQYVNPLAQPDGLPGYAVQWMEVDGPLYDDAADRAPRSGYALMFDDLPLRRAGDGEEGALLEVVPPNQELSPGQRFRRRPQPIDVAAVVETADPAGDARRLLRRFLDRAYRRPVVDADVERFFGLYQQQYDLGHGFTSAMISAYTAVLASPGFLFLEEKPGPLDDWALATRLALFLWNSEPDPELRALAAAGRLRDPAVLRAQTDRLIDDPKMRRFVDAFTDYWLDLRKFDDTSPSSTLYNDYELDDPLKQAAVLETQLFVQELVRANRPAREIVDSDFAFLNERLAEHYDVAGVEGARFRKVDLPADSVRGGLLTQASVLKVTANGTTTSPVIRGNWITERILGYQVPPPPPVPAVEPDIRGATTIREQLEAHRSDTSCASCHSIMDPPGFALESFDVMGGWRDRYRAIDEESEPARGIGMDGQVFAFHQGLPVDSAGELPDGRTFADIRDFKALLLTDEEKLARNLVRQLTIYATGAPVRFTDREAVEAILQRARADDYGVRTLVHEIVQSDLFQRK